LFRESAASPLQFKQTYNSRLAAEYNLSVIYKKSFSEVLDEEQRSRDFGPLLSRMGVVNDQGESAMDSDQWEAASEWSGSLDKHS
jgi:mRNA (guanine-N7-)-methyltransferase